jgi:hypothetical protein
MAALSNQANDEKIISNEQEEWKADYALISVIEDIDNNNINGPDARGYMIHGPNYLPT